MLASIKVGEQKQKGYAGSNPAAPTILTKKTMIQLIKIQSELKAPKNQTNKFGGYKYRSAEDILEAVKPLLTKYECFLTISDEIILIGERYYIKATATLINGENSISVSAFAREEEIKKGMDASQITGAASSYARKYALNGMFCIDDTKDADATNNHDKSDTSALNEALLKIGKASTKQELTAIWDAYKKYEDGDKIKNAIIEKRREAAI